MKINVTVVIADDSGNPLGTAKGDLPVYPPLKALWPDPLPKGQVGQPYSYFLDTSGGIPPLRFFVDTGVLPTGLFLNTSTGEVNSGGIPLTTPTTLAAITFGVEDSA